MTVLARRRQPFDSFLALGLVSERMLCDGGTMDSPALAPRDAEVANVRYGQNYECSLQQLYSNVQHNPNLSSLIPNK